MATLPKWNVAAFGCVPRDGAGVRSLMRTQLSASLPMPMVSRKADTQAPLELVFALDMNDNGFRAWQQWVVHDLADGVLPFTVFLPWGTQQPRVRARLVGGWSATSDGAGRWRVGGVMEIERETLPRFSGGAFTFGGGFN